MWMTYERALAETTGRPVLLKEDVELLKQHSNDLEHIAWVLDNNIVPALVELDPLTVPLSVRNDLEANFRTVAWRVRTTSESLRRLLKSTRTIQDKDQLVEVLSLRHPVRPSKESARWLKAGGASGTIPIAIGLSFPAMKNAGMNDDPVSIWGQVMVLYNPARDMSRTNWTTVTEDDISYGRFLLRNAVTGNEIIATLFAELREGRFIDGWNECCQHDLMSPGTHMLKAYADIHNQGPCFNGGLHWVLQNEGKSLRKYYKITENEWIEWANEFRKQNLILVGLNQPILTRAQRNTRYTLL